VILAKVIDNNIPNDVWAVFFVVCAALIFGIVAYYWR
jgi:hypothetical protein